MDRLSQSFRPLNGCASLWTRRRATPTSRCRRMTAGTVRLHTAAVPRVRSCSTASARVTGPVRPQVSPAGAGRPRSGPKARSRRSAGDRPAKASKKPRLLSAASSYRLRLIAVEDVGMGLPLGPVLIDVLHRNFNATPGGEWMMACHAVRLLASAPKDRTSSEHADWVAAKVALGEALAEVPDYAHCVHTRAGQVGVGGARPSSAAVGKVAEHDGAGGRVEWPRVAADGDAPAAEVDVGQSMSVRSRLAWPDSTAIRPRSAHRRIWVVQPWASPCRRAWWRA